MRLHFSILALALPLAPTLAAQPVPASLFDGLSWRLIGPFRGGRAEAATGVSGDPNTFYFGAVGGGIWKTTDAGMVWTPIFDNQRIASIGALGWRHPIPTLSTREPARPTCARISHSETACTSPPMPAKHGRT